MRTRSRPPSRSRGYRSDGQDLLAVFNGKPATRNRPIFWQWLGLKADPDYWPRLAVRDGDWKLVMTDDAKRVELHHLAHDRAEATNVAKDHPDIVARLSKLVLDWMTDSASKNTRPDSKAKTTSKPASKTSIKMATAN